MQVLDAHTKFAHLGKPGSTFSPGFQRRFQMMTRAVDMRDQRILDVGCGEGVWMGAFTTLADPINVFGAEYDPEQVRSLTAPTSRLLSQYHIPVGNIVNAPAEKLPFEDGTFDIVFSHEVLEHVQDDRLAVMESVRVLKSGGKFIVFTPNRGWPFEQHGMFWRGKYYWGNIPLLPWLPKSISRQFAPHVRNYTNGDIRRLFTGLPVKFTLHTHVFPGFDGMVRRFGLLGRGVRKFIHFWERTPLNWFGISHFVVVEKL